jgi:hypothetical protein
MLVFTMPVAGRENEYNEWYTQQHLADVVALPGFARAQRFRSLDPVGDGAPPRPYLAVYEIADGQVETAKASLAAARAEASWELSDAVAPGAVIWYFAAASDPVRRDSGE